MFVDILINAFWHAVIFIGLVYIVGYVISIINRLFYKCFNNSKLAIYGTGLIGTPIHELSHLLMCLVFGHKVDEVKFFQINDEDGVLGYVNHSWNPKNIYQQIGNYFIGIAPILVGTLIVFFGIKAFLPNTYNQINGYFDAIKNLGVNVNIFDYVFDFFCGMFLAMFTDISIGWKWWVFMLFILCIAIHMNLSTADIKNSIISIPLLLAIIVIVNLVIGFIFGGLYNKFLILMNTVGGLLISVLMLSLVLSIICLALALAIKITVSIIRRIFNL